jgi:hypothetical protein
VSDCAAALGRDAAVRGIGNRGAGSGRSDRHRLRAGISAGRRAEDGHGHLGKGKGGCRRKNAGEQGRAAKTPLGRGGFHYILKVGAVVVWLLHSHIDPLFKARRSRREIDADEAQIDRWFQASSGRGGTGGGQQVPHRNSRPCHRSLDEGCPPGSCVKCRIQYPRPSVQSAVKIQKRDSGFKPGG